MTVSTVTAETVKAKAHALGADLVGIASGAVLDRNPPDPARPQTPSAITPNDSRSVIVLARRLLHGLGRLKGHDDRHKEYSTELIISELEEIELKLVYFLEDHGHAALTVPPVHTDPRLYDRGGDTRGPLSLPHAAVEAGLGTLGLNLMLLTPEYGPRVLLGAVLTSAELEPDAPPEERGDLLKSREAFMAWQSILRGVGVYSGCTRCVDVCPVGADYEQHLREIQDEIPERTPEKEATLAEIAARAAAGDRGPSYARSARWIDGPASRSGAVTSSK